MIIAELYEAGIIRRSWKYRFLGENGEKFGDDYKDWTNARDAVQKLVSQNIGVLLRIRHRDGTVWNVGRIR